MKKSTALLYFAALQVVFLATAFLSGYVVRAANDAAGAGAWNPLAAGQERYPLLAEARGLLEAHFIGDLPDDKHLEYGALHGLVSAVDDPYTVFVEPQNHELESQTLQGEYGGVGATLNATPEGLVTLSPYLDSPAAAGGVLDGDVLLAVDGKPIVAGMALDDVTALVRGPVGTTLVIKVRHPNGAEATLSLVRQRFEIPSVTWKLVDGQPAIGLIKVDRFSDKTAGEVKRALSELGARGAAQYVLDLRNNGGGILEAGVDVAGLFLDGGVVMYESQRDGPERVYNAPAASGEAATVPLVVLVNHNTASAAEIVAGALLDRGRASLVGQATYGKGSVQLVYDLSDGSSLHVTAFKWYTPARRELEAAGLPPTFTVEPATDGGDSELAYAVQVLNAGDSTTVAGGQP